MAAHADILEDRESLNKPLAASFVFHAAVVAVFVWNASTSSGRMVLGETNPGFGSAVSVNSVRAIPLPPRPGPVNPVANDTESQVPQREAIKPQPRPREPELKKDAIPLKSHVPEKPQPHDYLLQKYRNRPLQPNNVTSAQPPAAVTQMIMKPGSTAGVGINPNSIVGTRFGGYAQALMEAVARHWNTGGLEGVQAPLAIVNVDIMRDGTIRNVKLAQPSGNPTLDFSAQRAVYEAAPFPPLPQDYSGGYLNVDFRFQLHP